MLKLEFTDVEEDRAAMLAQSVRRKLIECGAKPDDLIFAGTNKNNMGIGSILEIVSQINFLGPAEIGLHVAVIAHCIYDLLRREVVTVVVEGPEKKIEIRSSAMSAAELQRAIQQVALSKGDSRNDNDSKQ